MQSPPRPTKTLKQRQMKSIPVKGVKFMILFALLFACSACTTIEIVDRNGAVKVERSFGVCSIGIAPDAGVVTAKVVSLGYVASPLGYSVGYSKQTVTSSDDSCRVIIWVDDTIDEEALIKQLKSVNSACIATIKE